MFRTKEGRVRRWATLVLPLALASLLAGCYGRFQTTRAIYKWNGEVSDDKLVRSAVMWGLIILPVYYVGGLADLIVVNPLEYWKGARIELGSPPDAEGTAVALATNEKARDAIRPRVQKAKGEVR